MARQTHYEVQVFQNGRWSIHAQFEARKQEAAIEEGKALDQLPNIQAVKVVREVYDSDEGTHRDFIVYKSADAPPSDDAPAEKTPAQKSSWQDEDDDEDDDDDEKYGATYGSEKPAKPKKKMSKKPTSITAILVKLLLVLLFSICLAAIFTVAASSILKGVTLFGTRIVGNAESNLLFVTFVGVFLVSATLLAFTFLRGASLAERQQQQHDKQVAKAQARQQTQQVAAIKAEKKQEQEEQAARKKRIDKKRKAKDKAAREEIEQAMEGIEEFKTPAKEEDGDANDRLQEAINATSQSETEEETLAPAVEAEDSADALSPHAEKQKAFMMKFLDEAMKGANTDHKKLDNFNKFGVNLFLAGACETLGQTRELDEKSQAKVLADSVRVMGFKKSHAATFAGKYEEYLMQDPRYMQMFQAGRNSMNTYYQDADATSGHLEKALAEWNQPKPKEEQSGPITVLFTDIAGSTAMTQALGDAGAQKVVRAHNRVVRDALTDHSGKEIKHTGDGIMASFAKTTDSVAASIQMQRETMIHNQQNPDLPLHLKIGLNAGEPISEDNDLFGSTVQMSARIVDKAQADEIFVSEIVRGICDGKGYKFVNRGGYEMKGFSEPPTLFEVVWRDDGQAAAE